MPLPVPPQLHALQALLDQLRPDLTVLKERGRAALDTAVRREPWLAAPLPVEPLYSLYQQLVFLEAENPPASSDPLLRVASRVCVNIQPPHLGGSDGGLAFVTCRHGRLVRIKVAGPTCTIAATHPDMPAAKEIPLMPNPRTAIVERLWPILDEVFSSPGVQSYI